MLSKSILRQASGSYPHLYYFYNSGEILFSPWGVYSKAENQNPAHHINIKCEEKISNNKQRAIQKIGLLQANWFCLFFSTLMLSRPPLCILKEMTSLYQ